METALTEVRLREGRLRERRRQREQRLLFSACTGLGALLCAALALFGGTGPAQPPMTGYGTMQFPGAGGYVLAGVLAFMAGVAAAALCFRPREKRRKKDRAERAEAPQPREEDSGEGGSEPRHPAGTDEIGGGEPK